jgi:tetratricopeptide (TPR) repeat protein
MTDRLIKVFISAPSDVRPERLLAARIVQKLAQEFIYHFAVEAVMWEREPLVADKPFQESIPRASSTDIVVVIMWSRLGTALPEHYRGLISGKHPVTGTEFEFEDGLASARAKHRPHLLFYRKTAPPQQLVNLADRADVQDQLAQNQAAESFIAHWFSQEAPLEGTAAFLRFADAATFEDELETHLRATLRKLIEGAQQGETRPRWHRGSPFRGLERFEGEHAAVFFGRAQARAELRERLTRQAVGGCAFVAVVGASGAGKSSVVLAGLLPDLTLPGMIGRVALCRQAVMRPSDKPADPVAALAHAVLTALPELVGLLYGPADLVAHLNTHPEQANFAIRQGLHAAALAAIPRLSEFGEARLVLVVDQMEELFTQDGMSPEAIDRFAVALGAMARSDLAWIIVTMRSDFADRLEAHPQLAALCDGPARHLLLPPTAAEIGQIVAGPAREAGLRFESDPASGIGLDEMLREAAARQPGALPLLEFTLEQLWQGRTPGGLLTLPAYQELGGLEGAIGRRADEVLDILSDEVRNALPAMLRAMVTVGQGAQGGVAARDAALDLFPPGSPGRALIDAFQAPGARLVVADQSGRRVRVAHEALLTHWPVAQAVVAEARADLQLRARLEMAEARWRDAPQADQPSLLLPSGLPLSEAADFVARRGGELESALLAYVGASQEAEAATQQRRLDEERRRLEAEQSIDREKLLRTAEVQRFEAAASAERADHATRLMRVTAVAAAVLLVLLAAAAGAAIYASNQRQHAVIQRDRAEKITAAAEQAATGLVVDLAHGLRDRAGIPIDVMEKLLDQANAMIGSISRLSPGDVQAQRLQASALTEFSNTYLHAGDTRKALAVAEQAAALQQALITQDPNNAALYRDLAYSQRWIGEARKAQGDLVAALGADRAWLGIATKLARPFPADSGLQQDLASAARAVGDVQYAHGDEPAALASYRQSLEVLQHLAQRAPADARLQLSVSVSQERIGDVLDKQGDPAGALAAYQSDFALRQHLLTLDPSNATYKRDVGVAYGDIGDELAALQRFPDALAAYKAGMAISQELADADPGNAEWRSDLAVGMSGIGGIDMSTGDAAGAAAAYRTAVGIMDALVGRDPANMEWLHSLLTYEHSLADSLMRAGDRAGARTHAERGLELARRIAREHPDGGDSASDLRSAQELANSLGRKP